jgi:hypothetical protein
MEFKPNGLHEAASSNAELESLIERVVASAVARIECGTLKPFITCKECADLIGVTPEHLCSMRTRGEGPPWSGAGKWTRYERHAVLTWIANLPKNEKSLARAPADQPAQEPNP